MKINYQQTRWQQRFENFERAYNSLKKFEADYSDSPEDHEAIAVTAIFNLVFELSWKVMKDYMSYKGIRHNFPRDVLKGAFEYELITEGATWIDMLDDRNLLAHVYDMEKAQKALQSILNQYLPTIDTFYQTMKGYLND